MSNEKNLSVVRIEKDIQLHLYSEDRTINT